MGTTRRSLAVLAVLLLVGACGGVRQPVPVRPAQEATRDADDLTVHFLDVGQGDATLLLAPDVTMLIDTGRHDRRDVPDHLRRLGVADIDVVVVTHPHADHLGQFDLVLDEFDVAEVWWSGHVHTTRTFERALAALERSAAAYEEPRTGDTTSLGSLTVEILNPTGTSGSMHDDALALRITYGSVRFLFTGDAEEAAEARMLALTPDRLAADVYQVGHHGSATSTSAEFLAAVAPALAIYSAGAGNAYGHPDAAVLERLAGAQAEMYGTDRHGTVTVTTDGTSAVVETERRDAR